MIRPWQNTKKIHLVEVDKKFTWQRWTLFKILCLDIWDDFCTRVNEKVILKRGNFHRIVFSFIFDLFVFSWSGSSIGDQTFNWYEQLNSWLIFNWSEELNSWPSFDWSEQPHSWPNFENKEWPLRQKCQNLCKPKNF